MENEQIHTYLIPNNFIDESRTFNGMLKTRHVIEAVICLAAVAGPSWLLIPSTVASKWTIVLGLSLPLALLSLMGINGDSLFTFIKYATGWRKTKQVMLYNEEARTFQTRPIEVAMTELTPADRVMGVYDSWRENRAAEFGKVELVENVDFIFMEDTEYEKMTIVGEDEKEKEKEKEVKKQAKAAKEREKKQAKYEAQRKKQMAKEQRQNRKNKNKKAPVEDIRSDDKPLIDLNQYDDPTTTKEETPAAEEAPVMETFTFADVPVESMAMSAEPEPKQEAVETIPDSVVKQKSVLAEEKVSEPISEPAPRSEVADEPVQEEPAAENPVEKISTDVKPAPVKGQSQVENPVLKVTVDLAKGEQTVAPAPAETSVTKETKTESEESDNEDDLLAAASVNKPSRKRKRVRNRKKNANTGNGGNAQ